MCLLSQRETGSCWRNCTDGKILTLQALGPELVPQNSITKLWA